MFQKRIRVALILAVSGIMAAATAGAVHGPDFSGTWVLNADESEMPGPPGGGGGTDGGGRPPGGDDQRGQGGRGGRGGRGGMGRGMGGQISRMTITQQDDQLTIVAEGPQGGSREQVLKPGAGPQEVSTPRGDATVEANWEDHKLVVTRVSVRETPRGEMKIEQNQSWELSEDGQTLTQLQEIKTPRGTFNMKLVFDREAKE